MTSLTITDNSIIAIVGATATGKTAAGIAIARSLNGEIVGADSRQVYRGMAIGTAQPSTEQLSAVPHHLIAVAAPDEPFGLVTYLDQARAAIVEIRARGRRPIVVGGTGQYLWALLEGWTVPRVAPDLALRAELEQFAVTHGAPALHERLSAVDTAAARVIHPHNVRRVIRALEVHHHTGEAISAQQRRLPQDQAVIIGLTLPRDLLYPRIDRRVEAMYTVGLVDEVRALTANGYGPDLPGMASIGYPEAWAVVNGRCSIAEAKRLTQLATHRLARQQSTWFRSADPRINWLDPRLDGYDSRLLGLARRTVSRSAACSEGGPKWNS